MKQFSKVFALRHSSLLFFPAIADHFYKIQLFLCSKGLISGIYISRKENTNKNELLRYVSTIGNVVLCQSYKCMRDVRNFKIKKVADYYLPKNLNRNTLRVIDEVAWSIIWSDSVTEKVKSTSSGFLPGNVVRFKGRLPKSVFVNDLFLKVLLSSPALVDGVFKLLYQHFLQPIKSIVWDLDGTIFFNTKAAATMQKTFEKMYTNQIASNMNVSSKEAVQLFAKLSKETNWSNAISKLINKDEKTILLEFEKHFKREKYTKKDNQLVKLLNEFTGIRNLILTNATYTNTIKLLTKIGFTKQFEKLYCVDNSEAPKPQMAAFTQILKYTGLSPQEVLMVGDSYQTDILPAKHIGFKTCLVGHTKREPDYSLNNVFEVPKIFSINYKLKKLIYDLLTS